jgi:cation diffusion facilitator family transporter
MHDKHLHLFQHAHGFGQDLKRPGESRTVLVIVLTTVTMVVEVVAGFAFGSMALLADGLHMASHAAALSINAFAYIYARRHAHDQRYSFGTGKVNALGGFSGAVLLAVFALIMVWESSARLVRPIEIAFNQAIFVAVIGLLVNGASMLILGNQGDPAHSHGAEKGHHHHDHNLRSAYLHVLADALTSFLVIGALVAGKYAGLLWMDPMMGFVGAILVGRWSIGLVHETSVVLLDRQGPQQLREAIRSSIEAHHGDRVADLHLWAIGPNIYAVEMTIVTQKPQPPEVYKRLLPAPSGLVHVSVEVHQCDHS